MPISVMCQCGKEYQLSDSLAGKKGRCKACGTVFVIPIAQAKLKTAALVQPPKPIPTAQSAAVDLFGLDDGPAVASSPSSGSRATAAKFGPAEPDLDDEPEIKPRRRASAPRRKAEVDHEAQDKYRRSGISMLVFGGLAFVLPLIGLQWRLLNILPPAVQFLIAIGLIVMGIGSLGVSSLAQPPRLMGPVLLVIIAGSCVLFGVLVLPNMVENGPNPPPQFQPRIVGQPAQVDMPPQPPFQRTPLPQPNLPLVSVPRPNFPNYPPGPGPNSGFMQPMVPPNMGGPPGMNRPMGPGGLPGGMPRPNFPGRPGRPNPF